MTQTEAARLITTARRRRGITQAELARRAGLPRSVVNAYERGTRDPGSEALARLVRAAAFDLGLASNGHGNADTDRAGRLLSQVLDLAESLPFRRSKALTYPRFLDRVRDVA